MPEEAITFEYIREVQREEQHSSTLSKILEDFYDKVRAYLKQKKELVKKKKDRNANMEIRNIERILQDIFNRRETKIMQHALITVRTGVIPQNLISSEKEFFEAAVDFLKSQRERVLGKIEKEDLEEYVKIEFLEDVLEFVGIDLKKYGPYNKEDIAVIPKENAELFVKANKAKVIE